MTNEKYKLLFDELKKIKQLEKYPMLFSTRDKALIDIIEKEKPNKVSSFYKQFDNPDNISTEVAIALSKSKNVPKAIIDMLIKKHIPKTIPFLMQRDDLNDNNIYDLLTKTTNNEMNHIFSNYDEAKKIHPKILDNVLQNALFDIKMGRALKPYRIDVFSCSGNMEMMKEIFNFPAVPESVIAAIINNTKLYENDFLDKCFDLGCDFNDLKITTPYIINVVYQVAAETITEVHANTKEEMTAQANAMKIIERLITNNELLTSHREDLYKRLEDMTTSHPNRSSLLKLLIKTETSSKKLDEIMHSGLSTIFKRIAATNHHNLTDAKRIYIDKEIQTMCERLPTSISSFNFLSNVIKNTQLKKESYLRLINKHLSATKNEKLKEVIKDMALSQATPVTILEILSRTSPYPDVMKIATINLHCSLHPCPKGIYQQLLDYCFYNKSLEPDFKYTEDIKRIMNSIQEDKDDRIAHIKTIMLEKQKQFEETLKPNYKPKLTLNEYTAKRNNLMKQISDECKDSLYIFYQNVDDYVNSYNSLNQYFQNSIDNAIVSEFGEFLSKNTKER